MGEVLPVEAVPYNLSFILVLYYITFYDNTTQLVGFFVGSHELDESLFSIYFKSLNMDNSMFLLTFHSLFFSFFFLSPRS